MKFSTNVFGKIFEILKISLTRGMWNFTEFVDLEKMPKNAYLVAKIGFDAAENESTKVCQKVVRWLDYNLDS
jgi:hypothetical protein